jgi:protein SCO1/2
MSQPAERMGWSIWLGIIALVFLLTLALLLQQFQKPNPTRSPLPVISQVAAFTLTNQNNAVTSLADLHGHVWVADIIFTRCPGPCLRMSRQMKELQNALPTSDKTKLVSLTTDADYDTPLVLREYAERFSADSNRWLFLTGNKTNVANLAIDSLKLTAIAKKPEERTSPEDLFVHSTIFVIVDKRARLRGVFQTEGEDVDWSKMKKKILTAMKQLEREP